MKFYFSILFFYGHKVKVAGQGVALTFHGTVAIAPVHPMPSQLVPKPPKLDRTDSSAAVASARQAVVPMGAETVTTVHAGRRPVDSPVSLKGGVQAGGAVQL